MTPAARNDARARLILALDQPDVAAARTLTEALSGLVGCWKIGLQLIAGGEGLAFAAELSARGEPVFLDFKLHDIGATVEKAVRALAPLRPAFLTVHAQGGCVAAAVRGRDGGARPQILAVTVLTDHDAEDLKREGRAGSVQDLVLARAGAALEAGADGLVASAQEAEALRARFGEGFAIVTPGVRPAGAAADDQKRVRTPAGALAAGASHLVVGRPITAAPSPAEAARAILSEMAGALAGPVSASRQ